MPGKIAGTVVAISASGDVITSVTADQLQQIPPDAAVTVNCDGHQTVGVLPLDHQEPPMTLVAVVGPSRRLELRLVDESAHAFLRIHTGASVAVKW